MSRIVVTIGRQYGSGGREIGRKLAELLGFAFYDKELLAVAARESGLTAELFENNDETPVNSLLFGLSTQSFAGAHLTMSDTMPIPQKLFLAQFDAIRKIALRENCVIVGRCADYALRDEPNCINLFIHAPLEKRIALVQRRQNLEPAKAKEIIVKTDKRRAAYYNSYSDRRWGAIDAYHLSIDSTVLEEDKTVEMLGWFIKSRLVK